MTATEKTDYKFKWHRFQQRYEKIYTVKLKKALQMQVRQFADTGVINSIPIYAVMTHLYRTVGVLWAAKTGIRQKKAMQVKERLPMGFSERIVELMRSYYGIDLLNDAELMTRYSREVIADVLSAAAQTGASLDEVIKQLTVHPEFSAMRARRIARTETVTAANGAAIINAKESGYDYKKEWISITDKRTRHTHRIVDGSIVSIDTAFTLGDTQMMQPGVRTQPNGLPTPAKEVVNCRCTIGFIPIK